MCTWLEQRTPLLGACHNKLEELSFSKEEISKGRGLAHLGTDSFSVKQYVFMKISDHFMCLLLTKEKCNNMPRMVCHAYIFELLIRKLKQALLYFNKGLNSTII